MFDFHKFGETISDWPIDTNQSRNEFEDVGLLEETNLDLFISTYEIKISGFYSSVNFSQSEGVFCPIDESAKINLDIISGYEKYGRKTDVSDWPVDFNQSENAFDKIIQWNLDFIIGIIIGQLENGFDQSDFYRFNSGTCGHDDFNIEIGNWNSQFGFIYLLPIIFLILQIIGQRVNFWRIFIEQYLF